MSEFVISNINIWKKPPWSKSKYAYWAYIDYYRKSKFKKVPTNDMRFKDYIGNILIAVDHVHPTKGDTKTMWLDGIWQHVDCRIFFDDPKVAEVLKLLRGTRVHMPEFTPRSLPIFLEEHADVFLMERAL